MIKDWTGKRIVIVGAARQGLALTRFLKNHSAEVILTDSRNELHLKDAIESISDLQVNFVFGGHPLEILDNTDLLCLSGGVPLTIPLIEKAKSKSIPITNDSQIFLENCPCSVIGITGSAGKTTTTALVGEMAKEHMLFKNTGSQAWIGGNIGNPLIQVIDQIHEDDIAIVELSSFQLELMTSSPHVAAILNLSPNHLDRHQTMQAYREAKSSIITYQNNEDIAVLNRDDTGSLSYINQVRGSLISFGLNQPNKNENGVFINKENIYLQINNDHIKLLPTDWILLHGKHNLYNVLAACAIATGASIALPAIQAAIENFEGVPHRIEFVRTHNGIDWYNDSIATTPERTIAAIHTFKKPMVLLLGGRDKQLPWEPLVELIKEKVNHVIVFGEAADKIFATFGIPKPGEKPYTLVKCKNLENALREALNIATPGDMVLLSPGGTSFDEFKDFEERGEMFKKWVNKIQ